MCGFVAFTELLYGLASGAGPDPARYARGCVVCVWLLHIHFPPGVLVGEALCQGLAALLFGRDLVISGRVLGPQHGVGPVALELLLGDLASIVAGKHAYGITQIGIFRSQHPVEFARVFFTLGRRIRGDGHGASQSEHCVLQDVHGSGRSSEAWLDPAAHGALPAQPVIAGSTELDVALASGQGFDMHALVLVFAQSRLHCLACQLDHVAAHELYGPIDVHGFIVDGLIFYGFGGVGLPLSYSIHEFAQAAGGIIIGLPLKLIQHILVAHEQHQLDPVHVGHIRQAHVHVQASAVVGVDAFSTGEPRDPIQDL